MALDAELLDRFERDWNDALANYEARTTAARMGNVQYDPASRTFAPQEVEPSITRGIQSELFGPLQSKWGLLSEGAGRRQAAETRPQFFNTAAGVFMADEFGNTKQIVDVPTPARSSATTFKPSAGDSALMSRLGRAIGDVSAVLANPNLSEVARAKSESMRDSLIRQMTEIQDKYSQVTNAPAVQPPARTAAPAPQPNPRGYISGAFGENLFSMPGTTSATNAPVVEESVMQEAEPPANSLGGIMRGWGDTSQLPVGPSTSRGVQVLQIRRK